MPPKRAAKFPIFQYILQGNSERFLATIIIAIISGGIFFDIFRQNTFLGTIFDVKNDGVAKNSTHGCGGSMGGVIVMNVCPNDVVTVRYSML